MTGAAPSNAQLPPAPQVNEDLTASIITPKQTLDLLDGQFEKLSLGLAEDKFSIWLGSGISRERVADLQNLLQKAITFLQEKIDASNTNCRFKKALREILEKAYLSKEDAESIQHEMPFKDWPLRSVILKKLESNYAAVLGVEVQDEDADYLLWDAVDVCGTYADDSIPPDCEHLCIAILALEGFSSTIVSANWDGLIESAIERLGSNSAQLNVFIRAEDVRGTASTKLIKFHGCAVKAKENEEVYRPRLVASKAQIDHWVNDTKNSVILAELTQILVSKKTLMVGLSAQDHNIRNIFDKAGTQLTWSWPEDSPAYVFSADALNDDQRALLQNVYRGFYTPANRDAIKQSSLLRAYSKPLFTALVLKMLCMKLIACIDALPASIIFTQHRQELIQGILTLRNTLASRIPPNGHLSFIEAFIKQLSHGMSLFRTGMKHNTDSYLGLGNLSIDKMKMDTNFSSSGLKEFSAAAAILGVGVQRNFWEIKPVDLTQSHPPTCHLISNGQSNDIYIIRDVYTWLQLHENDYLAEEGNIIIHANKIVPNMQRSPRGEMGRTGRMGNRDVSISELLEMATEADDLIQLFKQEAVI